MELWQKTILVYCSIGIALCLYALLKYNKYKKLRDFRSIDKLFLRFFALYLLLIAAAVGHISYWQNELSSTWPMFVIMGMLIFPLLLPNKEKS